MKSYTPFLNPVNELKHYEWQIWILMCAHNAHRDLDYKNGRNTSYLVLVD